MASTRILHVVSIDEGTYSAAVFRLLQPVHRTIFIVQLLAIGEWSRAQHLLINIHRLVVTRRYSVTGGTIPVKGDAPTTRFASTEALPLDQSAMLTAVHNSLPSCFWADYRSLATPRSVAFCTAVLLEATQAFTSKSQLGGSFGSFCGEAVEQRTKQQLLLLR
jgi:hypothetical protein